MKVKTIKLSGTRKKVILCRTNDVSNQYVVMEEITKRIEDDIDKYNENPDLYQKVFPYKPEQSVITGSSVYLYGEIDFNNKEDTDILDKLNLVDANGGGWMYTGFDFDKDEIEPEDGKFKVSPTWNALKWFKYNYVLLGRPKRVIVYKIPHLNGKHK